MALPACNHPKPIKFCYENSAAEAFDIVLEMLRAMRADIATMLEE